MYNSTIPLIRLGLAAVGIIPAILATGMGFYSLWFFGAAAVYWWFVVDTVLLLKKCITERMK